MRKQHIYVNFKRFDVPVEFGGINRLSPIEDWAKTIVGKVLPELGKYDPDEVEFAQYYPETHIREAVKALKALGGSSALRIGCQGVHRHDTAIGGNFGAFTTFRPASAMKAFGVTDAIIGHCEERNERREFLEMAGVKSAEAVDKVLNMEVKAAQARGLNVLFCVGERDTELKTWDDVIRGQLVRGLEGADLGKVVVAYEPVWSIGPGKTPADAPYIAKVARLVKETLKDAPVVYGGGLKADNARMLSQIPEIDGGLIALTRFKGDIGFYPEEYLEIIRLYMDGKRSLEGSIEHPIK